MPTVNVLVVYDFDLQFTYVLTGWEGSAHDARILGSTMNNPRLKFSMPPLGNCLHFCPYLSSLIYDIHFSNIFNLHLGKYYLANKGYPDRRGILTPYSKIRYHQLEFRGAVPVSYTHLTLPTNREV